MFVLGFQISWSIWSPLPICPAAAAAASPAQLHCWPLLFLGRCGPPGPQTERPSGSRGLRRGGALAGLGRHASTGGGTWDKNGFFLNKDISSQNLKIYVQSRASIFNKAYRIILYCTVYTAKTKRKATPSSTWRLYSITPLNLQCPNSTQADCGDDGFEFSWRWLF